MSRRKEITAEEKLRIVRGCKGGQYSQREAGEIVGVGSSTIDRWIKRYESEGEAGLLPYEGNRKYSPELKTKAVLKYLQGSMSMPEVCKNYKIRDERQLRNWIKVYNAHGDFNSVKHSGGGSYMKKARSTSQEERLQIVKDCLKSGRNYGEMALKYNVSYQQVRTWTLRFEELGEAGLEDRRGKRKKDQTPRTELEAAQIEIENLKHKLYMAEMENHLLKNWTR